MNAQNWFERISELREMANDWYSYSTCTVREWVALNPEEAEDGGVQGFVATLIEMNNVGPKMITDATEIREIRRRLYQLAESDL